MELIKPTICQYYIIISLKYLTVFLTIFPYFRIFRKIYCHLSVILYHSFLKFYLCIDIFLWDFNTHCSFKHLIIWILSCWTSIRSICTRTILENCFWESTNMHSNLLVKNFRIKITRDLNHQVINLFPDIFDLNKFFLNLLIFSSLPNLIAFYYLVNLVA